MDFNYRNEELECLSFKTFFHHKSSENPREVVFAALFCAQQWRIKFSDNESSANDASWVSNKRAIENADLVFKSNWQIESWSSPQLKQ